MGNAGSNQAVSHGSSVIKETHRHSKEHPPSSPNKDGRAITFANKPNPKLVFQSSNDEEESYFSKVIASILYSIHYFISFNSISP